MSVPIHSRFGLHLKIVLGLLIIALVPLAVAAFLVDPLARVAQNFASNEAARIRAPLERSHAAYVELVATKKQLYGKTADEIAGSPAIADAIRKRGDVRAAIRDRMRGDSEIARVTVHDQAGTLATVDQTHLFGSTDTWQPMLLQRTSEHGYRVEVTFAASRKLSDEVKALGEALADLRAVERVRYSLPLSYRTAFVVLLSGVVLLVSVIGILLARRFTRRVGALLKGTQMVASGNLDVSVDSSGRDELAQLAQAFNRMVLDLKRDQEQIAYLQRVGAWQDVARRLAHEIKNPLTPIQLAVQQCVSSYHGDDERMRTLLTDTEEIVSEEIGNLKRLVDAFRTLGKLPRVEAQALDLGTVIQALEADPQFAGRLELVAPSTPVMVHGDKLLLKRVVVNLVENGLHAVADQDNGKVSVSWSHAHDGGFAEVHVDDNGAGIPSDKRQSIFEPYITSKELGTGLGLTISKKIAIEHGGNLEVSADASPLGGARFILRLPLAALDSVQHA